jgi:hypothetical protein
MSDDRESKQSEGDALYDVFSALSEKQKRRFLKRISDERRALRDAGRPLGRARIRGAPAMEDDEILGALRDCTAETGAVPTFARYVAWVNRPDVKVRPGRRPTSHLPFKRAFGSFAAARVAAGLMEAADDTALPSQRVIRGAAPRATAQQATANLRARPSRSLAQLERVPPRAPRDLRRVECRGQAASSSGAQHDQQHLWLVECGTHGCGGPRQRVARR